MTSEQNGAGWMHDRDQVRMLQHAHADHIESTYRAWLNMPGNPFGVVIRSFGNVRTFIASGDRLENRAIFSGDESEEQIDDVIAHFQARGANCVVEVNPGNYYVNPPRDWRARLLDRLMVNGCRPNNFRCVWASTNRPPAPLTPTPDTLRWRRFSGPGDVAELARVMEQLKPKEKWDGADFANAGKSGTYHYVAFRGDHPVASGSLFTNGTAGYLSYWETLRQERGQGTHQEAIRRRMCDAFDLGCRYVFSVTDFNFTSPRNLQRCGLHLAYNYLMLRREPQPVPHESART